MQVRGPSMHHWEAEQSGLHSGWSSFCKPSPELVPPPELRCTVQELTSAEWVSYCSQLQSLNLLHVSSWKLIGRTWLLQTVFKGRSALLWRRRHFQCLQGNFLDINLISLPGKFALVTIMPKSSKILWNVPLRANMEGFEKSNRTALNDYHFESFPPPVPFYISTCFSAFLYFLSSSLSELK